MENIKSNESNWRNPWTISEIRVSNNRGVEVNNTFKSWKHVFKLDPERKLTDRDLERICTSATDAIIVGGSSGITYDNTFQLLARIRQFEVPCVLEISDRHAVVPGFDMYLIPVVLNAKDTNWIVGHHHQALKEYGHLLNWDEVRTEGYIILNPQATVAQRTHADTQLDHADVLAYVTMADQMFSLPIIYIEYSGQYGNMELVAKIKDTIQHAQLFYGGGIDSLEKAQEASSLAHTIVVGNIIYTDIEQALQTVKLK
jgi:putative glycerol-1-phosphate prenyltransferase